MPCEAKLIKLNDLMSLKHTLINCYHNKYK